MVFSLRAKAGPELPLARGSTLIIAAFVFAREREDGFFFTAIELACLLLSECPVAQFMAKNKLEFRYRASAGQPCVQQDVAKCLTSGQRAIKDFQLFRS